MSFLGEENIDLRRRNGAIDGATGEYAVSSDITEITKFRGTWRPASERQKELLADGDRERDPRVLYTMQVLRGGNQYNGLLSDYVRRSDGDGAWYEVTNIGESLDSLPESPIRHKKYIVLRVQEVDA